MELWQFVPLNFAQHNSIEVSPDTIGRQRYDE